MSFIQTGFLIASAAVAIPVLVHLLSRWRVRRLELGTMRFLQEIVRDGAQRRRIRRWLLMFTRAALVVLLALLFARPFLPERVRRDGDRLRIVLIDRSASMGMQGNDGRLVDDAIGAAAELNSELGSDADVWWAWFDRHVQPLPSETDRPSAPRALVGDTNYFAALSWARDRIDAHPESLSDVVLVTDLQQSGFAVDTLTAGTLEFPPDVLVHVVDVGRPAANNLAISGVTAPALRTNTDQEFEFFATLFNYGSLPFEDVPLSASAFDGMRTVRLKKRVNVPSGQAAEVTFRFAGLGAGTWQLTLSLDVEDDLAADNRRFTAIEVAEPIRVLVFDSGSSDEGAFAESFFLATALRQSGRARQIDDGTFGESAAAESGSNFGRFRAEVVYAGDESAPPLDARSTPLVVVADAGAVSATRIRQLETYVRSGGKLLVFAGDGFGDDPSPVWEGSEVAPGTLHRPQRSGATPFRITSVSAGGRMLQPFEDPQRGDLSRLSFEKVLPITVRDRAEILARFDQERPALTQHVLGQGRVAWFLSSADTSWGNWPTSPLYLPLVQQMAADLLNLTGEGRIRFRTLGDEDPGPRQDSTGNTRVTEVGLRSSPAGPDQLGFSQPGFQQGEDALYVVNGSSRESDPTRVEPEVFAEQFDLRLAGATNAMVSPSVDGESRRELWPWLAAAAFVLLVVEFALANRTPA